MKTYAEPQALMRVAHLLCLSQFIDLGGKRIFPGICPLQIGKHIPKTRTIAGQPDYGRGGPAFRALCEATILPLLQFRILRFGFLQNRNLRVGIFPESQEVLIEGTGACSVSL
jgi:hypothetical protein